MEALLRINLPFEFSNEQTILLACPSFLNASLKSVNPSPRVRSPVFRISPLSSIPLISSLKSKLSQQIVRLDVPGSGEQAHATHRLEILSQFPQFLVTCRNCEYERFRRNWNGVSHVFRSCLRHFSSFLSIFLTTTALLSLLRIIATEFQQTNCR